VSREFSTEVLVLFQDMYRPTEGHESQTIVDAVMIAMITAITNHARQSGGREEAERIADIICSSVKEQVVFQFTNQDFGVPKEAPN
jgi:hypothetical protein